MICAQQWCWDVNHSMITEVADTHQILLIGEDKDGAMAHKRVLHNLLHMHAHSVSLP